jgi:hypothetical protein
MYDAYLGNIFSGSTCSKCGCMTILKYQLGDLPLVLCPDCSYSKSINKKTANITMENPYDIDGKIKENLLNKQLSEEEEFDFEKFKKESTKAQKKLITEQVKKLEGKIEELQAIANKKTTIELINRFELMDFDE